MEFKRVSNETLITELRKVATTVSGQADLAGRDPGTAAIKVWGRLEDPMKRSGL